jgi:hypothetical protein
MLTEHFDHLRLDLDAGDAATLPLGSNPVSQRHGVDTGTRAYL